VAAKPKRNDIIEGRREGARGRRACGRRGMATLEDAPTSYSSSSSFSFSILGLVGTETVSGDAAAPQFAVLRILSALTLENEDDDEDEYDQVPGCS
jgi:hypothetical protein